MHPSDQAVLLETRRQFFANGARGLGVAALATLFGRDTLPAAPLAKLESTFAVADANGAEVDQGDNLRWLGEMVLFPYGFVGDRIRWDRIDSHSARVSLVRSGLPVSAIVRISEDGRLTAIEADRYRDVGGGKAVLTRWIGRCSDYRDLHGFRVPSSIEAVWLLAHLVGDVHQPLHVGAMYFNRDCGVSVDPNVVGAGLPKFGIGTTVAETVGGRKGLIQTILIQALGQQACVSGYRVRYTTSAGLLEDLAGRRHSRPRVRTDDIFRHRHQKRRRDPLSGDVAEVVVRAQLVGFDRADDAGVYKLRDDLALIVPHSSAPILRGISPASAQAGSLAAGSALTLTVTGEGFAAGPPT